MRGMWSEHPLGQRAFVAFSSVTRHVILGVVWISVFRNSEVIGYGYCCGGQERAIVGITLLSRYSWSNRKHYKEVLLTAFSGSPQRPEHILDIPRTGRRALQSQRLPAWYFPSSPESKAR